jgi:hypothetical protein
VNVHAPVSNINSSCFKDGDLPYGQLFEGGGSTGVSRQWTSPTGNLFYSTTSFSSGTSTSNVQAPYINTEGTYKVLVTDTYGCKDSSTMQFSFSSCLVLPVSLLRFDVQLKAGSVVLNWATASEENTKSFIIERSTDMISWTAIGSVSAAGTSNTNKYYSFIDNKPSTGINYYRLKQVDLDGRISFSEIKVIKMDSDWKVQIYPNPVVGNVLHFKSNSAITLIKVIDSRGSVVLLQQCKVATDVGDLSLHNMAKGFYILQLYDKSGVVFNTRFIKQ